MLQVGSESHSATPTLNSVSRSIACFALGRCFVALPWLDRTGTVVLAHDKHALATGRDDRRYPHCAGGQLRRAFKIPGDQYVLSFGGTEDGAGAFNLGRAFGLDDLVKQLRKAGLSQDEMDTALQVLAAQAHHKIPHVKLTKTLIHKFGL